MVRTAALDKAHCAFALTVLDYRHHAERATQTSRHAERVRRNVTSSEYPSANGCALPVWRCVRCTGVIALE